MANKFLIKRGDGAPVAGGIDEYELVYDYTNNQLYTKVGSTITAVGGGISFNGSTANGLLTFGNSTTADVESNLTFDGSTLALTGDLNVGSGDFFVDDSAGRVGIGTTSPSYLLHLSGTAPELAFQDTDGSAIWRARSVTNNFHITETGAGDPFIIQSGAGANALVINSSGNVGIGTTSPSAKLHVDGSAIFDTDTGNQPFYITRIGTLGQALKMYVDDNDAVFESIQDETTGNVGNFKFVMDSGSSANTRFLHGTAEKFKIESGGNVVMQSGSRLYFDNGVHTYISEDIDDRLRFFCGGAEFMRFTEDTTDQTQFYTNTRLGDNLKLGLGNSDDLNIFHTGSQAYIDIETGNLNFRDTGANTLAVIEQGGNVGIGTNSPGSKLHIRNNSAADQLRLGRVDDDSYLSIGAGANNAVYNMVTGGTIAHQFQEDGDAKMTIQTNGNVGIGTTTPDYELDVAGDIGVDHVIYHNGDGNTYHQFTTDRQRFVVGSELLLDLYEDGTQDYVKLGDGGDVDINLNDDMFVRGSDGNVGIGTTSPGYKLDVSGTANVTDTISTDYGVRFNNGNTNFMFYNNTGDDLLYLRDLTNAQMLQTWTTSSTTIHKNLSVSGNVNATGDINVSDDVIINVNANYIYLRDASGTLTRTFGMNASNQTYIGPIDNYAGGSILYGVNSNVADQVFYTSGSERMRINSSGLIKVGPNGGDTTNVFEIDTSGSTQHGLMINADQARAAGRYALLVDDEDPNSRGSVVIQTASGPSLTTTGNVGIGTTSPSQKLHVAGTSFLNGQLYGGFGAVTTGGTADWNHSTNARSGNGHTLLLEDATNGPSNHATVNTANTAYYHTLSFEYSSYDGDANMTQIGIPYYFANNDGIRPVIRSRYSGNWSAYNSLITGNADGQIQGSPGTAAKPSYSFNGNANNDLDTGMFNPSANTIGFSTGGTEEFRMDSSGNFHADADVIAFSTTTASDIKFKENVKSIPYGLKEVLQMNPVEFDWIEKRNGTHDIGFIAQEMEKIVPEVIKETETLEVGGTHKTMDYAKLTSILVQAIQEQQQQINELKEKLNG